MTHILELFDPSKYVANFELDGKDVTVTISRVQGEEIIGEDGEKAKKPVIYFSDWPKPLVIGKRVAKTIWGMYGTDPKAWVGKRITLFPTKEKAFGEMHDVVRVRKVVPRGTAAPPATTAAERDTRTLDERAAALVDALKTAKTFASLEKTWNGDKARSICDELKEEFKASTLENLNLTYESQSAVLK